MKTPIIFAETVTSKTDNTCLFRTGQKYTPLLGLHSLYALIYCTQVTIKTDK